METKIIFIFVLAIPTLFEAWLDRRGETADGKRKDFWWSLFVALGLVIVGYKVLHIDPFRTLALLIGWRVLCFDYIVTWLLIKNDVIVGKWWNYTGKTSKWDKIIADVHWKIRLAVRVVIFLGALFYMLYNP